MKDVFKMSLSDIQPSQLYISVEKLDRARSNLNQPGVNDSAPLPVKRLDGNVILTDGHTRALAAYLSGRRDIDVYWDVDELDWEAYAACVRWCREEGIYTIADLCTRIVGHDEYETLWIKRCEQLHHNLKTTSASQA